MEDDRLQQFRRLVETDPTDALSWYGLASLHLKAHRYAEAAAAFRKVVELNPEHSAAYRHLGYSLSHLGDVTAANDAFQTGIPVAKKKGDLQAAKEMEVLLKKLKKSPGKG
ncbi:MAG: tetratricopeptide repeat protein [Acidobacteria bacterium]|nr:tetratricopeptide repeat protein [Acidobacteriota bacterium]